MLNLPNIDYVIGDSAPIRVELIDELTGDYYPTTGLQAAWFTLKQRPDDADSAAVIAKTLAAAGVQVAGSGQIDLLPDHSETANLVDGFEYFGDLRLKLSTGRIVSVRFTITARAAATQAAA